MRLLRLPQWLLDAFARGANHGAMDYPVVALVVMMVVAAAGQHIAWWRGWIYRTRDAMYREAAAHETHSSNHRIDAVRLLVFFSVALFLPAWTFDYWQA